MAELTATEGAESDYNLLFDGSNLEISPELDISDLSEFESQIPTQRARLAIVARGDHNFGIANMYKSFSGDGNPREIRVFRSTTEARFWLLGAC